MIKTNAAHLKHVTEPALIRSREGDGDGYHSVGEIVGEQRRGYRAHKYICSALQAARCSERCGYRAHKYVCSAHQREASRARTFAHG